jgi:hypothetical protein
MKKMNLLSVLLLFVLAVLIIIFVNVYSNQEDEIVRLEKELEEYQTSVLVDHELFSRTENYLEALIEGDARDFLSNRYLKEVESVTEETDHHHSTASLESMNIYNISVNPQPEGDYLVYIIYHVQLGGIDGEEVEEHQYRNMIFTTKLTFVEEDGVYKVDNSELRPIESSESFFEEIMR